MNQVQTINKKKKRKGFTLIELIIVLAVMAIIAAIAIPNFASIRDNSKYKADVQTLETIKRSTLVLLSDGTLKATDSSADMTFTFAKGGASTTVTAGNVATGTDEFKTSIKEVGELQLKKKITTTDGKNYAKGDEAATGYSVTIKPDGTITVQAQ